MVVTKPKPVAKRKRGPNAHTFEDGGALVTGTHDVELARDLANQAEHDMICGPDGKSHTECDRCTDERGYLVGDPRLEVGRINPPSGYDYSWMWVTLDESKLGTPGVTRACVWYL